MNTYALIYTYDDQDSARDAVRPEHRAYLASQAESGAVLAYGRWDDDGAPGALIIVSASSADAVEALADADPFVAAGLVPERSVRLWPAMGPWTER